MSEDDLRGVDEEYMPTQHQKDNFWRYIIVGMKVDPTGWWYGWCPVHDADGSDPDNPTAMFNFRSGSFKCLSENNGTGCMPMRAAGSKPKQAMSLTNLEMLLASSDAKRA